MEKHISVGDRLVNYFDSNVSQLSSEEIQQIIKNTPSFEIVTEIFDYDIKTLNKEDEVEYNYYYSIDLVFHAIVLNDKGELMDREELKKDLLALYPNLLLISPERLSERIKKGYSYKFYPMGIPSEVEQKNLSDKKSVVKQIDMGGVVSQHGFLDLSDTIMSCVYYDFEDNLVDTSDLKEDLQKRWLEE